MERDPVSTKRDRVERDRVERDPVPTKRDRVERDPEPAKRDRCEPAFKSVPNCWSRFGQPCIRPWISRLSLGKLVLQA